MQSNLSAEIRIIDYDIIRRIIQTYRFSLAHIQGIPPRGVGVVQGGKPALGRGTPLWRGILLAQPAVSRLFDASYSVMQCPITVDVALCRPCDLDPTCAAPLAILR